MFKVDPSLSKAEYGIAIEINETYVSVCVYVCVCYMHVRACNTLCVYKNLLEISGYACYQGFSLTLFDLWSQQTFPSTMAPYVWSPWLLMFGPHGSLCLVPMAPYVWSPWLFIFGSHGSLYLVPMAPLFGSLRT